MPLTRRKQGEDNPEPVLSKEERPQEPELELPPIEEEDE